MKTYQYNQYLIYCQNLPKSKWQPNPPNFNQWQQWYYAQALRRMQQLENQYANF